jgi:ATP-binding cassette subfamily F protein 3
VLKEAIRAFDGTAIIVSHDREFLDGLVSKVYEFGGGKVRECIGGIYDWIGAPRTSDLRPQTSDLRPQTSSPAPSNYEQRKELQRKKSRLEKQVKEVETKIEKLEARIKELDAILCTPEGASDMTVVTEYTSTMKVIEKETERWEQLSMELEEIII